MELAVSYRFIELTQNMEAFEALGALDVQRRAGVAGDLQRAIGLPQRLQHLLHQRAGHVVGRPVDRRLRLPQLVGEVSRHAAFDKR